MGQIKSTTIVKRNKSTHAYAEQLKHELQKSYEDLEKIESELIEQVNKYKQLPFDSRHNTEEYKKLMQINDSIDGIKDDILYYSALSSDILYANIQVQHDIKAYEVIKMKSPTCFEIRRLKTTLLNKEEIEKTFIDEGLLGVYNSDIQQWDFNVDEDGEILTIKFKKDGWFCGEFPVILAEQPIEYYEFNV